MDDLLVVHNQTDDDVDEQLSQVYQNTLQLKKTHNSETSSNYLDLAITITNDKISTKLYNKTDDFSFNVIRFPYSDTNISLINKSSVIYTETLRLANTCSFFNVFVSKITDMVTTLLKNGYEEDFIVTSIVKCIYKNKFISYKYSIANNFRKIKRLVTGILICSGAQH